MKKRDASGYDNYSAPSPSSTACSQHQRKKPMLRRKVAAKFAGETVSQQAGHLDIARRYAWKSTNRRNRYHVREKRRLRDLEALFAHRWGSTLPDDDAGRDDLFLAAHQIAQLNADPAAAIGAWATLWAPWMGAEELAALVARVLKKPLRWTADTLAWRLGLTFALRMLLGITTIGSIDLNKAGREKRRQREKNIGRARLRRDAGAVERAEYEAVAASRSKPWLILGISRATWYRRGKPQATVNIEVFSETSARAPDAIYMLGAQLSHDKQDDGRTRAGDAERTPADTSAFNLGKPQYSEIMTQSAQIADGSEQSNDGSEQAGDASERAPAETSGFGARSQKVRPGVGAGLPAHCLESRTRDRPKLKRCSS